MKKSALTIGILAILGFAYVGTSWYTGNVIENNIDNKIKQFTDEVNIHDPKYKVSITYHDYHREFFSTKLHLTITRSPKEFSDTEEQPTKLFDDEIVIHHGPFPIAGLSKGVFTPQMVWIDYQMTEQASPELWKLAGNQPFITGYMGISYFKDVQIKLNNKAILFMRSELSGINDQLEISNGDWSFATVKDSSNILANMQLDHFAYTNEDDPFSIQLNKLNLTSNPNQENTAIGYELHAENIYLSEGVRSNKVNYSLSNLKTTANISNNADFSDLKLTIGIDKFFFASTEIDPITFTLNQIAINLTNKSNNQNYNDGSLTSSISSLIVGKHNLGKGIVNFDYQNINPEQLPPCLFNLKHCNENNKDIKNFNLSLNKFNWHTEVGDINIRFLFDYLPAIENDQLLSNIERIDKFKLNVDAPIDVLNLIIAQLKYSQISPIPQQEDDRVDIEETLTWLFNKNILFTLNKGDIKGLFSDIDYTKNDILINANGKKYVKEDFF